MTIPAKRRKRTAGQSWLTTLLGVVVLIAGGFALGLIVGIISEEPELVVGHVAGRSTEVEWSAEGEADLEAPPDGLREPDPDEQRLAAREPAPVRAPEPEPTPVAAPVRRTEPGADLPAVSARGEAPPALPAAGRIAAASPSSRFSVQVGAFGEAGSAHGIAGRLREEGYPVQVVPPSSDDRWRVRVGPMNSRAEAEQAARRLKLEQKLPTWVLREHGS